MTRYFAPLVLIGLLTTPNADAQSLLPKGVGAVQLGYRSYATQSTRFDASGESVSLGAGFDKEFSGKQLLASGSGDLQRLASELQQWSLAEDLELGTLRGDVQADVKAYVFGVAFGVTSRVTLFAGIPWVDASVDTALSFSGPNNAAEIRDRLGALAYEELRAGLTRASQLNAAAVEDSIEAAGYAPVSHWERRALGDARLGARFGHEAALARRVRYGATLTSTLLVPTGAPDDPDVLTDVETGGGHFGLDLAVDQRLTVWRHFYAGGVAGYTANFDTTLEKRVPENGEAIVARERKTRVRLAPGDDTELAAYAGARRWGSDLGYRLGVKRHYADRYDGSLDGDYAALAAGSDTEQVYHRISLGYDTIAAYKRGAFPLPFMAAISAQSTLAGRNVPEDTFIELSLTGFFAPR